LPFFRVGPVQVTFGFLGLRIKKRKFFLGFQLVVGLYRFRVGPVQVTFGPHFYRVGVTFSGQISDLGPTRSFGSSWSILAILIRRLLFWSRSIEEFETLKIPSSPITPFLFSYYTTPPPHRPSPSYFRIGEFETFVKFPLSYPPFSLS